MYILNQQTNQLDEIVETTFYENDLKERQHIEEWLRKNPEVLDEDLLIIGHEYDKFEVNERLDLLALDKEGNLVIIEVKRDVTGGNVDIQSLKYASYCSRLSPNDVLDIFSEYIEKNGLKINALDELMTFLGAEDEESLNSLINTGQRIIIVGKEFDKRILSVCAWLYENNINVKCISIKPYNFENKIIIDFNQIVPPYRLEDYFINKKLRNTEKVINIDNEVSEFLQTVASHINSNTDYKVRYGGRRYYFVGVKFLYKPLNFVFAYSKRENTLVILLESKVYEGQELLKKLYEDRAADLVKDLGCQIDLIRGAKNYELYKLVATIKIEDNIKLVDYTQIYLDTFIKFKEFVETEIRHVND